MRQTIRQFIIHKVGDGNNTSTWYDTWSDYRPLEILISSRDIRRAGFTSDALVYALISNNVGSWPTSCRNKYPMLDLINPPKTATQECIRWRGVDGELVEFSVKVVWESLRPRAPAVNWYNII
ncbi:uncharacterized protein [Rutidosis leptorrhynchoides]|uniref:uncharacterized protein n=1 Tax=Rutidosis leptorrhynchoides TaxID=125765 RepID=UPI003A991AD6